MRSISTLYDLVPFFHVTNSSQMQRPPELSKFRLASLTTSRDVLRGFDGYLRTTKRSGRACFLQGGKSPSTYLRGSQKSPGMLQALQYPKHSTKGLSNRDDMAAALNKAAPTLGVTLLLETLRQTLDFEQSMANKFSTTVRACLIQTSRLEEQWPTP